MINSRALPDDLPVRIHSHAKPGSGRTLFPKIFLREKPGPSGVWADYLRLSIAYSAHRDHFVDDMSFTLRNSAYRFYITVDLRGDSEVAYYPFFDPQPPKATRKEDPRDPVPESLLDTFKTIRFIVPLSFDSQTNNGPGVTMLAEMAFTRDSATAPLSFTSMRWAPCCSIFSRWQSNGEPRTDNHVSRFIKNGQFGTRQDLMDSLKIPLAYSPKQLATVLDLIEDQFQQGVISTFAFGNGTSNDLLMVLRALHQLEDWSDNARQDLSTPIFSWAMSSLSTSIGIHDNERAAGKL